MNTPAIETIERVQGILHEIWPDVEPDGDIGRRTRAALDILKGRQDDQAQRARHSIQLQIQPLFPQVLDDGSFGPITMSALRLLDEMGDRESLAVIAARGEKLPMPGDDWHIVTASSFADPQDVTAFRHCKSLGGTDLHCFAVGDNGVGAWGADCTANWPMVALPREDWRAAGKRGGDIVEVMLGEIFVRAELGDTMPSRDNIRNGAGMDCNPCLVRLLRQRPPMMLKGVGWRWPLG